MQNPNIGFIRRFQWNKRKRGMVSHSPLDYPNEMGNVRRVFYIQGHCVP